MRPHPVTVAVLSSLAGVASVVGWARRDYAGWTALGEGGIPWGLRGWLRMVRMRAGMPAVSFDTSHLPGTSDLADLPHRRGERPGVAPYPIPHRQAGADAAPWFVEALEAHLDEELDARAAEGVTKKQSQVERRHDALYSEPLRRSGESRSGEVVHVHRPQGSLHVHLLPADAKAVMDAGWGEPHALGGPPGPLPTYWMLLYLPRDEQEITVIRRIGAAALDRAAAADQEVGT